MIGGCLLAPLSPVKMDVVNKECIVEIAIGHVLADKQRVGGFKTATQEGYQGAMARGTDDASFIKEGLLGTEGTIRRGCQFLNGHHCSVQEKTLVHSAKRTFTQQIPI